MAIEAATAESVAVAAARSPTAWARLAFKASTAAKAAAGGGEKTKEGGGEEEDKTGETAGREAAFVVEPGAVKASENN